MVDALLDLYFASGDSTKASNFASLIIIFSSVESCIIGRDPYLCNHQVVVITRSRMSAKKQLLDRVIGSSSVFVKLW
jgi:hypothetical protein